MSAQTSVDDAREAAIGRVVAFIRMHPEGTHVQQDLADLAAMNTRAFSRLFLVVMGVGTKTFIRTVRVARAKQLLDETDLSVTQVMQRSGFASTDAGRRAFVSLERMSPARYRDR